MRATQSEHNRALHALCVRAGAVIQAVAHWGQAMQRRSAVPPSTHQREKSTMIHTVSPVRSISISLASGLALLMVAPDISTAKPVESGAPAPGQVAQGTADGKAVRPRDQRRKSDHASAKDPQPNPTGRGAGPDHDIRAGSQLPSTHHNNRSYVVDDWRAHRLSAPPRGQHWVQIGSDYVLVNIVGGVVTKVLLID